MDVDAPQTNIHDNLGKSMNAHEICKKTKIEHVRGVQLRRELKYMGVTANKGMLQLCLSLSRLQSDVRSLMREFERRHGTNGKQRDN